MAAAPGGVGGDLERGCWGLVFVFELVFSVGASEVGFSKVDAEDAPFVCEEGGCGKDFDGEDVEGEEC